MRKLDTIQKRNKLNNVYAMDAEGPGGANHCYNIYKSNDDPEKILAHELVGVGVIEFQNGPRNNSDSIAGVLDTDLLEIVRDRLSCFQKGQFSCRENAIALTKIEEALLWLNKRVEDHAERNVLGTNER